MPDPKIGRDGVAQHPGHRTVPRQAERVTDRPTCGTDRRDRECPLGDHPVTEHDGSRQRHSQLEHADCRDTFGHDPS